MLGWILSKLAGGKVETFYTRVRDLGAGYRTHILGVAMVARGVASLIDSMQGTSLSYCLQLFDDPAIDTINMGLAMMTGRAAITKVLASPPPPPQA